MSLRIAFVAANTFEFDSRTLRAATTLARDGHEVVVVAQPGPGLATEERLPGGVRVVRPPVDRRIASAFRPLPRPVRSGLARVLGFMPEAVTLPPSRPGLLDRLRGPLRRAAEILAYRRRIRPWAEAVVAAEPWADVVVAKALVALPVAVAAARGTGGRYVYDVADLHVESGRLARLPGPIKRDLVRRERAWVRGAAALLASTPAMADEAARRFDVPPPVPILNVRPRWRAGDPAPCPGRLRAAAGLEASQPVLLYQGAFREGQGIEELLLVLDDPRIVAAGVVAVFLGFGRLEARLRGAAAAHPGRVVVLPPVPSGELLDWTCDADLAFVGTPPTTINQRLTTPNKLFESLAAGVPVLVAADTFTASLVAEAGAGVVVAPWTPGAIAAAIARFIGAPASDRAGLRARARAAALERYNWETEARALSAVFRRLEADR